jgi:hypothetical protein
LDSDGEALGTRVEGEALRLELGTGDGEGVDTLVGIGVGAPVGASVGKLE